MTINNKSERNYRGKCLGWPVTSYGADPLHPKTKPLSVCVASAMDRPWQLIETLKSVQFIVKRRGLPFREEVDCSVNCRLF